MPLTLLVLAAGMGSRYGGLKQIDPVGPGGETLMDYSIYDARRAGFDKLVFVIRRDIERPFRETVGRRFEGLMEVEYAFQELNQVPPGFEVPAGRKKPWGTGHALLAGASVVREPFAAINADDLYGSNSFRVLADHLRSSSPDYAMVGFVLRNTLSEFGSVARGVCRLNDTGLLGSVVEITRIERDGGGAKYTDAGEKVHRLTGEETVSLNMWGFGPSIFPHLETEFKAFLGRHGQEEKAEFYIPSVVNTLVSNGAARVRVLQTPDSWFGITYREDRERVITGIRQLIERGDYPAKLW